MNTSTADRNGNTPPIQPGGTKKFWSRVYELISGGMHSRTARRKVDRERTKRVRQGRIDQPVPLEHLHSAQRGITPAVRQDLLAQKSTGRTRAQRNRAKRLRKARR